MIRWNWVNSWKAVFLLLGLAFVFYIFEFIQVSRILALLGVIGLVTMIVLRPGDVQKTLDDPKPHPEEKETNAKE